MIDREAYEIAQAGMEAADAAILKLQWIISDLGPAAGSISDALHDCIGAIKVERMEMELTCEDYRNASNRLSVEP